MNPPKAKEIDVLIEQYASAQGEQTAARMELAAKTYIVDGLKAQLLAWIEAFGAQHTAKSKRIEGHHHKATATTGTLVQVNDAAVETFRAYLEASEVPEIRERFFSERVSYQMVAGPAEVLRELTLPARMRKRMEQLVALCFGVATRAPSLKVDLVEVLEERG